MSIDLFSAIYLPLGHAQYSFAIRINRKSARDKRLVWIASFVSVSLCGGLSTLCPLSFGGIHWINWLATQHRGVSLLCKELHGSDLAAVDQTDFSCHFHGQTKTQTLVKLSDSNARPICLPKMPSRLCDLSKVKNRLIRRAVHLNLLAHSMQNFWK